MDFKILLENITPVLKSIARKRLLRGFYSEDDLFQEMCLYLWQEYGEGLPVGINQSYAIKGCEFHLLNYLRKGRRQFRYVSIDEPLDAEGSTLKDVIADPRSSPLADMDNRLTIDDIRSKGLTQKEEAVLSLLLYGYTVREIAEKMGISHVMVVKYKKKILAKVNIKGYQK